MSFETLARALTLPGQPEVALKAIEAAAQELIGHRLFTILVLDHARGLNSRYYTSHPVEYPVGGFKPIDPTREFYEIVVNKGEPRYLPDRETIIRTFPDHPRSSGWAASPAVNFPVRWDGRTLGSLNLLHDRAITGRSTRPRSTSWRRSPSRPSCASSKVCRHDPASSRSRALFSRPPPSRARRTRPCASSSRSRRAARPTCWPACSSSRCRASSAATSSSTTGPAPTASSPSTR
jgi:hypothetical protein